QELPVAVETGGVAVVDGGGAGVGAQAPGPVRREQRTRVRGAAIDRHQDEARGGTGAQLLDQQALRGARAARQERRQIGGVGGARRHGGGGHAEQRPDQRAGGAGFHHGGSSGPTLRME